jgi:hypothetical protein
VEWIDCLVQQRMTCPPSTRPLRERASQRRRRRSHRSQRRLCRGRQRRRAVLKRSSPPGSTVFVDRGRDDRRKPRRTRGSPSGGHAFCRFVRLSAVSCG